MMNTNDNSNSREPSTFRIDDESVSSKNPETSPLIIGLDELVVVREKPHVIEGSDSNLMRINDVADAILIEDSQPHLNLKSEITIVDEPKMTIGMDEPSDTASLEGDLDVVNAEAVVSNLEYSSTDMASASFGVIAGILGGGIAVWSSFFSPFVGGMIAVAAGLTASVFLLNWFGKFRYNRRSAAKKQTCSMPRSWEGSAVSQVRRVLDFGYAIVFLIFACAGGLFATWAEMDLGGPIGMAAIGIGLPVVTTFATLVLVGEPAAREETDA